MEYMDDETSKDEIERYVNILRQKKTAGWYEIPHEFYKRRFRNHPPLLCLATCGASRLDEGSLDGQPPPFSSAGFRFFSDASFFFVVGEAHTASGGSSMHITLEIPLRIVLWQHVGDLWPLGGNTKEKWPARLLATRPLHIQKSQECIEGSQVLE